jgi:hypothetical protein
MMNIDEDFSITEKDEEVLKELRKKKGSGVEEEVRVDPVTGRKEKKKSMLNKKKLSKHEMDEFFMDF